MTQEYYTKNIYGIEKYYIVENGFQQIHKGLTGCDTLREKDFQLYQSIGITFKQVLPPKK
jgi:hypothetical protein